MKNVSTEVKQALGGGHRVNFTIDNQTFSLQTVFGGNGSDMTSEDHAKWYEKNLKTAFMKIEGEQALAEEKADRLLKFITEKGLSEEFQDWLIDFNLLVSD